MERNTKEGGGDRKLSIDYKDLGDRIQTRRAEKGLTQQTLAEQAQTSPQHVSNIENAKTKISLSKLMDIINVLDTTPNDMLCGSVKESREIYQTEIAEIIQDFSPEELRMVPGVLRSFDDTYKAGQNSRKEE